MMDITHENNDITHWENMFSWVHDQDFERIHPLYRARRGYYSARCWYYYSAAHQHVNVGFRPAIDGLNTDALAPDENGVAVIGTLFMGSKPVKVPMNPVWNGDITSYIPDASLEMRAPLDDPAYQVKGIVLDDGGVIVDRVLLSRISYEEIEKAIAVRSKSSAATEPALAKSIATDAVLFLDMDGTLAEWHAADTYEALFEKGYFLSLQPHTNVVEAARQLQARGVSISTLSAYLDESDYALDEKRAWLNEHAPFIVRNLFCSSQMTKPEIVCKTYGRVDKRCVLLDDYSENLHAWVAAGGTAIKLLNGINGTKGTWQGPSISRFASPEEIADYIADILESISEEDTSTSDHRDGYLAGGYVLLHTRAILDDEEAEALKGPDETPLAQIAVKRDWLERWLADSEYNSIDAFLNAYTAEDIGELRTQAVFEGAVAFIYGEEADDLFKFPAKCDTNAMLAFADFLSGRLQENGYEDASKYLDALFEF